jgi:two-component system sensor histidine kinase KdpD
MNRATASMLLLIEVLSVAALGDWLLAVAESVAACLALSWYYIEAVGSLRISTPEGWVTFFALLLTALAGSRMAVAAQRRAAEAERRREEVQRLQALGQSLLSADTWRDAAETAVRRIVELFGVGGAAIGGRDSSESAVFAGSGRGEKPVFSTILGPAGAGQLLEVWGPQPSPEVLSAMGQMVGLALDRATQAEQRSRMEVIRRGEELRGMVLSSLAQDFRTPLTSIKVASSVLRGAPYIPPGPGRELVHVIDEEADRLDHVLRESLKMASIESCCENARMVACSLAEITGRVMQRAERYVAGREVLVNVSQRLSPVTGDPVLLEQMLFELVDNAWKYSTPGSDIKISAVETQNRVVLTVSSSGSEILDYERELIFAKFYRGAVQRSQVEGTGLGLAIARSIADAHLGSIWVDADSGNHAFRVSLPVESYNGGIGQ